MRLRPSSIIPPDVCLVLPGKRSLHYRNVAFVVTIAFLLSEVALDAYQFRGKDHVDA